MSMSVDNSQRVTRSQGLDVNTSKECTTVKGRVYKDQTSAVSRWIKDYATPQNAWRAANAAVAVGVLGTYFFNRATANPLEYGFDVLVHALNACVTADNSPLWLIAAVPLLNGARIVQIDKMVTNNTTTIARDLDYKDVQNHIFGVAAGIFNLKNYFYK